MHDIKWIREYPTRFDACMHARGESARAEALLKQDETRRSLIAEAESLQAERNKLAKQVGQLMGQAKQSGDAALLQQAEDTKAQAVSLAAKEAELKQRAADAQAALLAALEVLPNILAEDIPTGKDESFNVEVKRHGTPPELPFTAQDHVSVGEPLGLELELAASMSGARFALLTGQLARLERALGQYMLDVQTMQYGYTEVAPPVLVQPHALYNVGQLPKFAEDVFSTGSHYLIPTAEVPLTNMVAGQILDSESLPLRYTALTPCFRSEAGSAGRDTRGMIRVHQFHKVELVSITTKEQAEAEHERMLGAAEYILQQLGLAYRVMLLCSGDTGFSSQKTYDIEVWLPSQQTYREISSCSHFGEFQGRRMQARHRPKGQKSTETVHTLNGSGLAVGRTLVAILENYQQADGSVLVPEVLHSYMGGITHLTPRTTTKTTTEEQ